MKKILQILTISALSLASLYFVWNVSSETLRIILTVFVATAGVGCLIVAVLLHGADEEERVRNEPWPTHAPVPPYRSRIS